MGVGLTYQFSKADVFENYSSHLFMHLKNSVRYLEVKCNLFSSRRRSPWRQCGRVVRAPVLKSGGPEFKSRSDRYLELFYGRPGFISSTTLITREMVLRGGGGKVYVNIKFNRLFPSLIMNVPFSSKNDISLGCSYSNDLCLTR